MKTYRVNLSHGNAKGEILNAMTMTMFQNVTDMQ
jgi:hypothetical protein